MPTIIHPDQCCSVPGRSSEDNATLLRDVCDYLEVNERMACAFISIDQEKAFDYVDWDFLDRILGTMNFGPQFRSYIKSIYHDIRSAIISNGYVSEFFTCNEVYDKGARYLHCCLSWWRKCLDKRFESAQKYRDGVSLEGRK
jgi:hypothetical protein